MKKIRLSAKEKKILDDIYQLILEESLTNEERKVLTKGKLLIEAGEYIPQVLQRIQVSLTLLALIKW